VDTEAADEIDFDLADKVEILLDADPSKWWTPSAIARRLKADYFEVYDVLRYMVEHQYLVTRGNGSWTRFAGR
jgi:hypothetical protein